MNGYVCFYDGKRWECFYNGKRWECYASSHEDTQNRRYVRVKMSTLEKLQAKLAGSVSTLEKPQAKLAGSVSIVGSCKCKGNADHVKCADGTTISVQASQSHCSTPRSDYGPYTHVEVWLATAPVTEFDYDEGYPSAYVPIEKVVEFIDNHGGFKS